MVQERSHCRHASCEGEVVQTLLESFEEMCLGVVES
jgi:hypothetical protein